MREHVTVVFLKWLERLHGAKLVHVYRLGSVRTIVYVWHGGDSLSLWWMQPDHVEAITDLVVPEMTRESALAVIQEDIDKVCRNNGIFSLSR